MKERWLERNVITVDDRQNPVSRFVHLPNDQPFAGFSSSVKRGLPQSPEKLHETQSQEKQQCPQGFAVVLSLSQLFVHKLFDVWIVEYSLTLDSFLAQVIQHKLSEIAGPPLSKRDAKSFLL